MEKTPLGLNFSPRFISPLQRFTLSEMSRRRRKGRLHSTSKKQFKKSTTGKYWNPDKYESMSKVGIWGNSLSGFGETRRSAVPSNIEILGEIARIVTSTKILSGKIKVEKFSDKFWLR